MRLALGSDTYSLISKSLAARLADLEAQKELACSTDCDDADHSHGVLSS